MNTENVVKETEYEQMFISKVILLLTANPDDFSAKWFDGKSIDSSIRSSNKEILIMDTGQIVKPINPIMTKHQREFVSSLIRPIIARDKKFIIDNFIKSS